MTLRFNRLVRKWQKTLGIVLRHAVYTMRKNPHENKSIKKTCINR